MESRGVFGGWVRVRGRQGDDRTTLSKTEKKEKASYISVFVSIINADQEDRGTGYG